METLALTAIRFGLDTTWKATVLLALVLCLVAAFRRASASFRHLAAALGLAGVLALPLAALLVPRVAVPLVPSVLPEAPDESEPASLAPSRVTSAAPLVFAPGMLTAVIGNSNVGGPASACPGVSTPARPAWPLWAIAIWAAGALLAYLRLFFGALRVRAIARKSDPLRGPACLEAAEDIARRLGLKSRVRILTSVDVPVAMTTGVLRPILLLNTSAPEWPVDLRRAVLLHELAHVQRWDWITY